MVAIKGHFDGKVFVPEEPVDLPRGQAVVMHVMPTTPTRNKGAAVSASSQTAWDVLQKHAGSVDAPADWSAEHDHYLYGTPKSPSTARRTMNERAESVVRRYFVRPGRFQFA